MKFRNASKRAANGLLAALLALNSLSVGGIVHAAGDNGTANPKSSEKRL